MVELLLELPDGSKSLVPAAWTDAQPSSGDDAGPVATLGSLADLLHVCELIAELRGQDASLRRAGEAGLANAEFGHHPGLEERFHQREHALVFDPCAHPVQ